jgi:dTDP-4-dehydrorhamnose 3,5-epimerase
MLRMKTLSREEIAEEFRGGSKTYVPRTQLEGVRVLRLARHIDDRGFFLEVYRNRANHAATEELAKFWEGIETAQLNYSIVSAENHIKGLHYHLRQEDIWFCPPPSKIKIVLYDIRKKSPTFQKTQVLVAGDGQDLIVRIPEGVAHGYRPLTNPCALLYVVTKTFDLNDPDEYRIPWDHPAVKDLWDIPNG